MESWLMHLKPSRRSPKEGNGCEGWHDATFLRLSLRDPAVLSAHAVCKTWHRWSQPRSWSNQKSHSTRSCGTPFLSLKGPHRPRVDRVIQGPCLKYSSSTYRHQISFVCATILTACRAAEQFRETCL